MGTGKTAGPVVVTGRLILEPLIPQHAVEMVPVLGDTRLYEFIGGQPPTLEELSHRYVLQLAGGRSGHQPGGERWLNWIIRSRDAQCALGFVQATIEPAHQAAPVAAELAWVMGRGHQGRGYATEAAQAMVGWLIRQGVSGLSAGIHPGNLASAAVAARLGLAPTGLMDADGEQVWRLG